MATATLPLCDDTPDVDAESAAAAEAAAGRALRFQITATLVGATLLVCSLVAQVLWKTEFHAAVPAALAVLLLGAPLVWAAVADLLKGEAGMNALVALAVVGAAATGRYQESAAIALFMIVSGLIEKRTAIGAQASIESLIKLSPTKAHRLLVAAGDAGDVGEELVEAKDLRPGDVVRVRPGDNIPADGKILRGSSTVNQASITGESLPVDKAAGDEAFGGTINLTGVLDIEVLKAGADTLLGRVKDLILQAERTRTPIMRLVDQYAVWYTPTVLMLVGVVLFFALRSDPDTAFSRAIAMLVVACPSALILATPTAMVAGLSAAALAEAWRVVTGRHQHPDAAAGRRRGPAVDSGRRRPGQRARVGVGAVDGPAQAEQRRRAILPGFVEVHQPRLDRGRLANLFVDDVLDPSQFVP
jgi:Cd2+/Zn2+-exporting ATPase